MFGMCYIKSATSIWDKIMTGYIRKLKLPYLQKEKKN